MAKYRDEDLRLLWRSAGGIFYGDALTIRSGSMREDCLFRLLRHLLEKFDADIFQVSAEVFQEFIPITNEEHIASASIRSISFLVPTDKPPA